MKTIPVSFLVAGMLLPAVCHAQSQEPPKDKKCEECPPARPFIEKWKAADQNHDGFISLEEFTAIPRIQNLPEEKRAQVFKRLDKDTDGKLSSDELGRLHKPHDGKPCPPRLWQQDSDKSGGISFEEFKAGQMFMKLSPERQQAVFRRLDTDNDGVITPKDRPQPCKQPAQSDGKPLEDGQKTNGFNLKLDLNGDGALSFEEFRAGPAVKTLTEDRQEARFEQLDRNHDLKISPDDFSTPASQTPN